MKRVVFCVALALIVLFVILLLFFSSKNRFVVPFLKQYDVFYGDSPIDVDTKIPGDLIEKGQLTAANKNVYKYETTVMDTKAQINCFYINDKSLVEVDIIFLNQGSEQIVELFEQAKKIIQEEYKDNESFECDSIVYSDKDAYYLSLGLRDGATGIDYLITVKNDELHINCVDCR